MQSATSRGQPLLHLQPPRKAVEHARQLGDADDAVARQIGDRRLADDRRHVMLAMRLERDVLEQHDLVIAADLLEGTRSDDAPGLRHSRAQYSFHARATRWAYRADLRASGSSPAQRISVRMASATSSGTGILGAAATRSPSFKSSSCSCIRLAPGLPIAVTLRHGRVAVFRLADGLFPLSNSRPKATILRGCSPLTMQI